MQTSGDGPRENYSDQQQNEESQSPQVSDSVSFENFAMFLNLVNNVYIRSSAPKQPISDQVIEEEELDSDLNRRPYGFVDS